MKIAFHFEKSSRGGQENRRISWRENVSGFLYTKLPGSKNPAGLEGAFKISDRSELHVILYLELYQKSKNEVIPAKAEIHKCSFFLDACRSLSRTLNQVEGKLDAGQA
jgi:hypothetical protein